MDPEDSKRGIQTTWGGSKTFLTTMKCFGKAARLFSPPFEPLEITYEKTTLPGYF